MFLEANRELAIRIATDAVGGRFEFSLGALGAFPVRRLTTCRPTRRNFNSEVPWRFDAIKVGFKVRVLAKKIAVPIQDENLNFAKV